MGKSRKELTEVSGKNTKESDAKVKIDLQGHERPASSTAGSTLSSASSSTFPSGNRSPVKLQPSQGATSPEKTFSAESIIGYVHNLSNLKTSASNNPYFDLTLQTPEKTYRTVCYSPEKHQIMKRTSKSASPVKIGKFHFQMNNITHREEINLNKRSKLEDAPEQDITFEYDQSLKKKDAIEVTVEDAKKIHPKGIQNFKKMLTCVKCHRNIIPTARKIIKCCECNTTQLTANCEKTAIVSALFTEAENNRTVLLTNVVLKQILQTMPDCQEDPFDVQDDDLCELLLTCESTISVNMNYVAQLYSPPNE
eukprot:gene14751-16293_t